MTVEYRTGDLFDQNLPAIGHGVNCQGVMGAGIALEFKRRWPLMYAQYSEYCYRKLLKPGGVFTWKAPEGVWIYNLATQNYPGADATVKDIQRSLYGAIEDMVENGISAIGIPRIGAGIGGLPWHRVMRAIDDIAVPEARVHVVVVSLP